MKQTLLFFNLLLISTSIYAQNYWNKVEKKNISGIKRQYSNRTDVMGVYTIDIAQMRQYLKQAPMVHSGEKALEISIPVASGEMEKFAVFNDPVMEQSLENRYNLNSYIGVGIDDKSKYIRFSTSPTSIETMIIDGKGVSQFIDPYTNDKTYFFVHNKTPKSENFTCSTPGADIPEFNSEIGKSPENVVYSNDQKYRTLRLALSCTGEYGQYFGGTVAGALEAMNATMTRVNGVFEKELALKLIMIDNTNIIYTDPDTDPYADTSFINYWNLQLMMELHNNVGDANFDIGHLFGASGGGGNAGCIGCICSNTLQTQQTTNSATSNYKGSGITSPADGNPSGDGFDIDFVAHEMGHQLGANHTFSHVIEATGANMEPASGSTIMGYAGVTQYNVQLHSDPYFHWKSIQQIQNILNTKTCDIETTNSNTPPTVVVGDAINNIPKETAFYLDATGTYDTEGDSLTYCWEQINNATTNITVVTPTQTQGPIFRSFNPSTNPRRYLPSFTTVLDGKISSPITWETVSNVGRTLYFAVTVRDNGVYPQTANSTKQVVVSPNSGPFKVNYPTLNQTVGKGTSLPITWDVANTTSAPINTQNVKISLILDHGDTKITLIESTPNDGSETVSLPSEVSSTQANIMVEAVGNIYYAVSPTFQIGYNATITCNNYTGNPSSNQVVPYGNYAIKTFTVPQTEGVVTDVNVTVNSTTNFPTTLISVLQSPSNTLNTLWFQKCFNGSNLNATFDDEGTSLSCDSTSISSNILPITPLAIHKGISAGGNWYLGLMDTYFYDAAVFNSASLQICTTKYTESSLGVDDTNNISEKINIYPNPSNSIFNIDLGSKTTGKTIVKVYDMAGALIYNTTENDNKFIINLSNNISGVYIANFETMGQKFSKKIIKK